MRTADLILRIAASAQLLLLALLLLKEFWRTAVGMLGALFAFGVASYLICPLLARDWRIGAWENLFLFGCFGVAVFFWLFSRALFDDRFRLNPAHALAVAAVVGIGFWRHHAPWFPLGTAAAADFRGLQPWLAALPQFLSLSFVVLALAQAQLGRGPDLVAARRRIRDALVVLVGAYMVIVVATEILLMGKARVPMLELINVAVICLLVQGFLLALVRLRPGVLAGPRMAAANATAPDPAERQLRDALMHRFEVEKGYRDEGLDIATLARQLQAPEYRLRRLINGGLGYRNFNEFLNAYRVGEARERLRDPELARLPGLTIAMDLGYRSLGPFNRAFKEITGMTPSAYRHAGLSVSGGGGANPA